MAFDPMYQITSLSGGRLQISEQPQFFSGFLFLLMGLIPSLFFIYRMVKSKSFFPAFGLLFGFVFLFGAVKFLSTGSLTLDRRHNTAEIYSPSWLWHRDFTIPLNSIHRAEIRSMRSTDYVVLILDDGSDLTFADSSQEDGKGQAVKAINGYIGYNDY